VTSGDPEKFRAALGVAPSAAWAAINRKKRTRATCFTRRSAGTATRRSTCLATRPRHKFIETSATKSERWTKLEKARGPEQSATKNNRRITNPVFRTFHGNAAVKNGERRWQRFPILHQSIVI